MKKSILNKIFLVLLLTLVISLSACGGSKEEKTDVTSPDDETSETVEPETEEPTVEPTKDPMEGRPHYVPDEIIPGFEGEDDKMVSTGTTLQDAVVVFHYQRKKADYKDWGMWLWVTNGKRHEIANRDTFGVYYKINLGDIKSPYYHATYVNYLYFRSETGSWEGETEKDAYSADRTIEFSEDYLNDRNEIHFYSFEGDGNIYLKKDKSETVCVIKGASLNADATNITVKVSAKANKYELINNGEVVSSKTSTKKKNIFTIKDFDLLNDHYKVRVTFANGKVLEKNVDIVKYYQNDAFDLMFGYDGRLGVNLGQNTTEFNLWAPLSSEVTVNLYNYGHPTRLGTKEYPGDDEPCKTFSLTRGEKGAWHYVANENLAGKYYTYTVKNGDDVVTDIVDPYAFAAGLNGMRGYIVDFDKVNPEGWEYGRNRLYQENELVVYETHVRDLTMDKSWNGPEEIRGTFLGMVEPGTTYTKDNITVTTGFDHIKELGINAIQILPFFDQDNDELSDTFNWGYNPQNYNVIDGQYSTNPYDAEVRIKELKQMIMAFNNAGIEVIMDVVYNHMAGISNSSFDKILPGYFFRYNEEGNPSSGSGCGNDTASEHYMMSRFIVDSTNFWATEYNLGGFRFDLMGLHDVNTMQKVVDNLKSIDSEICVYGEPWVMSTSADANTVLANQTNHKKLDNIGMFSDGYRNAVLVGGAFHQTSSGWVQGAGAIDFVEFATNGSMFVNPYEQVSYITCHDGLTLHDKLIVSGVKEEDTPLASVVANGVIFTSAGIKFFLNGEEILRNKIIVDEEGNPVLDKDGEIQYSNNSYNQPDRVNSIKWGNKVTYLDTFNSYKEMIHLVRNHGLFQIREAIDTEGNYILDRENSKQGLLVYDIIRKGNINDSWSKVKIVCANKLVQADDIRTLALDGDYKVALTSGPSNVKVGDTINSIQYGRFSFNVLYQA